MKRSNLEESAFTNRTGNDVEFNTVYSVQVLFLLTENYN